MAETFESQTLTVRIARPLADVYAFAAAPENLSRWASGLARSVFASGSFRSRAGRRAPPE
jgi:uncharacterized protein YndB with AHSA1/START domain